MREQTYIDMHFPIGGLVETTARGVQPENTCSDILNMRAVSPTTGRNRGAQRSGLAKWSSAQVSGSNRVQNLNHVTTVQTGSGSQSSLSIRTITLLGVSNGNVRILTSSASTAPGTGSDTLSSTAAAIFSAPLRGVMYYTDGSSTPLRYTVSNDTLDDWEAAVAAHTTNIHGSTISSTFPKNGSDYPRLIEVWNGRIVLSGIESDPHNWFMSGMSDPLDFDYTLNPAVKTQAVAGNTGNVSTVGDVVMSLLPYNDDLLLIGCDHSIYQMTGDPMAGGSLDRISEVTGMAWGRPWCVTPEGIVYFFGSRGGVYRMVPGSQPERLTATKIDERMSDIDMDSHLVRMAWDDEGIGIRVLVTNINSLVSTHWYYDIRNDAFFPDRFASNDYNPVAVHVLDGDSADDRVTLLGGEDGYVRYFYEGAKTDDGSAIDAYVTMGPIQMNSKPFLVTALQGELMQGSNDVTCEVGTGRSVEDIRFTSNNYLLKQDGGRFLLQDGTGYLLLEDPSNGAFSCTLSATKSVTHNPRRSGYYAYVRLRNATAGEGFEIEKLRLQLSVAASSKGWI